MISDYLPILIVFLVASGFVGVSLVLSHLLGPRVRSEAKAGPYESGVDPVTEAHVRMSVRYFLIATLFIIFDIEIVFLYPWAVIFRESLSAGTFLFWEMMVFLGILIVGYVYAWRVGALEWE